MGDRFTNHVQTRQQPGLFQDRLDEGDKTRSIVIQHILQ